MLNVSEESVKNFISLQYKSGNSKDIQVLCSYAELKSVFERIKEQWIKVGEVEPYSSVLSEEKYKTINIKDNLNEFHETGKLGIDNLKSLSLKNDISLPNTSIFELGCGVGRSTQYFASEFESVHAWDVSSSNLIECRNNILKRELKNINLKIIQTIEDYSSIPLFDVFFSEIVLQHNPPPLQYYMLDKIFSKLKPGGVFMFQTITHHDTYSYNIDNYLNWNHQQDFEMHVLPMRWINRLIRKNNLFLMDVIKDRLGGYNLDSNTFYGIKPY